MNGADSLSRVYEYILGRHTRELKKMFSGPPAINTPLSGQVDGEHQLNHFIDEEGAWLIRHIRSIEVQENLEDDRHAVCEYILHLLINGKNIDIPVLLVGDKTESGFGQIRFYHSSWPIKGHYVYRSPVCWPVKLTNIPEVLQDYFQAVREGNYQKIAPLLNSQGSVRESSENTTIHQGEKEYFGFFRKALQYGPIHMHHCSCTLLDNKVVMEYICDHWGRNSFDPMAACTHYELTPDLKKIHSLRIYEDVTPHNS